MFLPLKPFNPAVTTVTRGTMRTFRGGSNLSLNGLDLCDLLVRSLDLVLKGLRHLGDIRLKNGRGGTANHEPRWLNQVVKNFVHLNDVDA